MRAVLAALTIGIASPAMAAPAVDYVGDARALDRLIVENYAYPESWPEGGLPDSAILKSERERVHDRDSLLHYAEHRIASLADHHAITGSSFSDSWGLVPTYSDVWIVERSGHFMIDAVRADSPAEKAGIRAGDELTAVDDIPIGQAVDHYWAELGLPAVGERRENAARVLAAGRRDRSRKLTMLSHGVARTMTLPNLYAVSMARSGPLDSTSDAKGRFVIRINNSLGDGDTIKAFDEAMANLPKNVSLTIDLRDTPSGGNTSVARAIMSWFVDRPMSYQVHTLPAEERETGIARQWIEQVLPRIGKHFDGRPNVLVGRWTGSMGEGLAIGLAAIGAPVCGGPMARLKGAVYDFTLPSSGLTVKFPAERLRTISGQPREDVIPEHC